MRLRQMNNQGQKEQGFERFMAFVLLRNSDQAKHQSLMNGLISQYSMENDQYTKTITMTTDILANHRHDNSITKHGCTKKKGKQNEDDDRSTTTNETSFVQSGGIVCYCCGKKGHRSPQCPEKDTRPKDQLAIRKAEQHL